MAKELPYFKFYTDDWLLGKIMDLSPATRGYFMDICAMYWRRSCTLSEKIYSKSCPNLSRISLESEKIIVVKSGKVSIKFLDEQYAQMLDSHNKRVSAGSKGGKAKKVAMLQAKLEQSPSILEVDVEVDVDIYTTKRLLKFCQTLFHDDEWHMQVRQMFPVLRVDGDMKKGRALTSRALGKFMDECSYRKKQHENLDDVRNHFANWMKKQNTEEIKNW